MYETESDPLSKRAARSLVDKVHADKWLRWREEDADEPSALGNKQPTTEGGWARFRGISGVTPNGLLLRVRSAQFILSAAIT